MGLSLLKGFKVTLAELFAKNIIKQMKFIFGLYMQKWQFVTIARPRNI